MLFFEGVRCRLLWPVCIIHERNKTSGRVRTLSLHPRLYSEARHSASYKRSLLRGENDRASLPTFITEAASVFSGQRGSGPRYILYYYYAGALFRNYLRPKNSASSKNAV